MHGHQGGKYDSVLTNQMLFRNRVYDVQTMRWMQQDPLGYVDGMSLYQAYGENPVDGVDPNGLSWRRWTRGWGAALPAI
jgi:RHS repeat-associated protein